MASDSIDSMDLSEEEEEVEKLTKLAKDHSSEEEEEEEDDDIEEKEDDNGDFEDEEVASLHLARHPPELHLPAGVTRGGDGVQQPVVVNAEDVFATYGEIIGLVDDDDDDASLYEPSSSEVGSSAAASSAETSRAPSRLEEGEQEKLLLEAEAGNVDNEEEEEEEEDADIPVSYYNALLLNERYQRALQDLISSAREALEDNLFRQREVTAEIEERNRDGDKAARGTGGGDNISMAKRSLAVFNPPYFKDARGFSHPPNPDTVAKRERQELDVYLSNPREWTSTEKARLKRAVKEDALRERMKSLIEAKDALVEEGKARGASRKSKERIMEQLRDLKARSDEVLSMPDEELFHNREEDFDWMRISVQTFNGSVTPKSCQLMWKNLLHPTINNGTWTKEEDAMLLALADESGGKHWDTIAAELNTGRTGFLCFMRYQQKNSHAGAKLKWSRAEDDRLKQLVERCRINSYVPWSKISYHMNKRTKEQCYQRHQYSLRDNLRKGAFTDEEDFMIVVGVRLFGESWVKIARFIPHRTAVQLHSRYNAFLNVTFESWTPRDDYRLLELVKEHGSRDWVKVASEFGGKTRTQCRNRFHVIYNWYEKDPENFNLNKMRSSSLQKKRQSAIFKRLDQKLSEFLDRQRVLKEEEEATGVRKAELEGYHTTPDGVRIPNQVLYDFMLELKAELPGVEKVPEYLQRKPISLSDKKLGLYESKPLKVRTLPSGKVLTLPKSIQGRPPVPHTRIKRIGNGLLQFFRPSWSSKRGRRRVSSARDINYVVNSMEAASEVLGCGGDRLDLSKITAEDLDDMENSDRFLTEELVFRKQNQAAGQASVPVATPVAAKKPAPAKVLKTYTRKKKVAATTTTISSSLAQPPPPLPPAVPPPTAPTTSLIPPCHATLVGFRGLLLHQRHLRQASESQAPTKLCHRYRPDADTVLRHGIYHADILDRGGRASADKEEAQAESPSHFDRKEEGEEEVGRGAKKAADELLFQRFKALFFWPAVMSAVKPNLPNRKENLFLEESYLSASRPYDASEIVEQARNAPPAKRLKVIKRERRPSGSSSSSSAPADAPFGVGVDPVTSSGERGDSSAEEAAESPNPQAGPSGCYMPPPSPPQSGELPVRPPKKRHYNLTSS